MEALWRKEVGLSKLVLIHQCPPINDSATPPPQEMKNGTTLYGATKSFFVIQKNYLLSIVFQIFLISNWYIWPPYIASLRFSNLATVPHLSLLCQMCKLVKGFLTINPYYLFILCTFVSNFHYCTLSWQLSRWKQLSKRQTLWFEV